MIWLDYDTELKPSSSCLVFWNPRIAVLGPLVHILHLGSVLRSLDIWIGGATWIETLDSSKMYLKPCDCWDWVALDFEETEYILAFSWGELVWRFDELRLLSFRYNRRWILLPILRKREWENISRKRENAQKKIGKSIMHEKGVDKRKKD